MSLKRRQHGFTLTELAVAIAVLAVMLGALAPVFVNHIRKAREARAKQDIAVIAEALQTFRGDVRNFPDRRNGNPGVYGYLTSGGALPRGRGGWQGPRGDFATHLLENNPPGSDYPITGTARWVGPYLSQDLVDPWGQAYIVSVAGLRGETGLRGWILSAGPNGTLETDDAANAIAPSSDDIGWRLR